MPLAAETIAEIDAVIEAIESVIKLPAYQAAVLSWAPDIARFDSGVSGVFFGYDFHLSPTGVKLIEINSNAGSAALSALLAMAQEIESTLHPNWETDFAHMFLNEWQTKRGDAPLSCVAIVDDEPSTQYLYPDFLLFQHALEQQGIKTIIVDPRELSLQAGCLYHQETRIDLVYNRLTDFSLEDPAYRALREAYLSDAVREVEGASERRTSAYTHEDSSTEPTHKRSAAVALCKSSIVLTPNPRSHALYADKRNLTVLSDTALLRSWGVAEAQLAVLANSVLKVYEVDPAHADELWQMRKQLFFKPVAGYGGKGAYRGERISRPAFNEVLQGNYVAQTYIPASEQQIHVAGEMQTFKLDIRRYVYQSKPVGIVARLYQGQVTNMRTPGGGFATVAGLPH